MADGDEMYMICCGKGQENKVSRSGDEGGLGYQQCVRNGGAHTGGMWSILL